MRCRFWQSDQTANWFASRHGLDHTLGDARHKANFADIEGVCMMVASSPLAAQRAIVARARLCSIHTPTYIIDTTEA